MNELPMRTKTKFQRQKERFVALTAALSAWNHQRDGRLVSEAVPQARDAAEAARGCYEQLKSLAAYLETKRVPIGDKVAARSVIERYEEQ